MTTDEYVPTTDHIRAFWASDGEHVPAAKSYNYVESYAEFERWLAAHDARVRRDAAREALDGLIADKAHTTALLHAENGGNVEDVLTHYRDTHYPEGTP